jgi:hypothetical protein
MRSETLVGPRGLRLLVEVPQTRPERMRGLLGRPRLPPDRALLLEETRSVHTFGMRFPIKVAFLRGDLMVLRVACLRPGRIALPRPATRHVLELSEGADVRRGDHLMRHGRREGDRRPGALTRRAR